MLTLTFAGFLHGLLVTAFVLLCVMMCLIILIQKPKGGGLSGAFGGAGGGSQMFGGKAGDILTWITVSFFVGFLLIGMALVVTTRSAAKPVISQENLTTEPAPDSGGATAAETGQPTPPPAETSTPETESAEPPTEQTAPPVETPPAETPAPEPDAP